MACKHDNCHRATIKRQDGLSKPSGSCDLQYGNTHCVHSPSPLFLLDVTVCSAWFFFRWTSMGEQYWRHLFDTNNGSWSISLLDIDGCSSSGGDEHEGAHGSHLPRGLGGARGEGRGGQAPGLGGTARRRLRYAVSTREYNMIINMFKECHGIQFRQDH